MNGIRTDPRLRVLYLAGVAIGIFFLSQPRWVGLVASVQVLLWFLVGLSFRGLLRQLSKLWLFGLMIVLSYALTAQDPQTDRWIELSVAGTGISLNMAGLSAGLVMLLRLATVVLVSQVVRVPTGKRWRMTTTTERMTTKTTTTIRDNGSRQLPHTVFTKVLAPYLNGGHAYGQSPQLARRSRNSTMPTPSPLKSHDVPAWPH